MKNLHKERHKVYVLYEAEQTEMPTEDYSAGKHWCRFMWSIGGGR